jgi:hypothetical protein
MKTSDLDSVWIKKDSTTYGKLIIDEFKKAWDYPKAWESPEFKQKVAYNYKEIDGKTLVISVKEDNDIACIFGTEESTGITYLLTVEELK